MIAEGDVKTGNIGKPAHSVNSEEMMTKMDGVKRRKRSEKERKKLHLSVDRVVFVLNALISLGLFIFLVSAYLL